MGTYTSSKTILGLPYDEFVDAYAKSNELDEEDALKDVINMLDEGEIEYASPYYDSDRDAWVVGYEVGYWGLTTEEFISEVLKTKQDFIERFKFEPKVYGSAHVW